MKKTDKTALTAALFTAAMSAAAMCGGQADAAGFTAEETELSLNKFSSAYAPPPSYFYTDIPEPVSTDPFDIIPQPDYGPIYIYTTAASEPTTEPVTEIIPQPAYGPMWTVPPEPVTEPVTEFYSQPVYGPPLWVGDLNGDGEVDTFDLVKMRRIVSEEYDLLNGNERYAGDVNGDHEVNVADLVSLGRYLIGRPAIFNFDGNYEKLNEDVSDHNWVPVVDEDGRVLDDPMEPIPEPAYGPPIDIIEDETEVPTKEIEEPTFQAVYGPPSFFGLEDE